MLLENDRLIIRMYDAKDFASIQTFFSDLDRTKYYLPTTWRLYNPIQLEKLLSDWNDLRENFIYIIDYKTSSEIKSIGAINIDGLDFINRKCELGVCLFEKKYCGKSLAKEAMILMLDYLFCQFNLNKVNVQVIEDNIASYKLFEKLNFRLEGTKKAEIYRDGKYLDMKLYALLCEEFMNFKNKGYYVS